MSSTLRCTLTTPEGALFEGEALSVVVPATDGELGILPRHAALLGALGCGELRLTATGESSPRRFFVDGGFVEVLDNVVTVLATRAAAADAMDAAAEEARVRELEGDRPAVGAPEEVREAWERDLDAARQRWRVASRRLG